MSESWEVTDDWSHLLRLHRRWNPGLYELADQYSHLLPSDLVSRGFRAWMHRQGGEIEGYALARVDPPPPVFYELWCPCTGLPSWRVAHLDSDDEGRVRDAARLLEGVAAMAGRRGFLRAPTDNAFGLLAARRLCLSYENTFLLATRRPGHLRVPALPKGHAIRSYRLGDAVPFHEVHVACFQENLGERAFLEWASAPASEAFAATFEDRVVGFIIAEVRRGGKIGDINLAVAEGHRGRGLGSALLDHAMRSFAARGVETAVADHWALNAPAAAFYRKHGFRTERTYHFFSFQGSPWSGP